MSIKSDLCGVSANGLCLRYRVLYDNAYCTKYMKYHQNLFREIIVLGAKCRFCGTQKKKSVFLFLFLCFCMFACGDSPPLVLAFFFLSLFCMRAKPAVLGLPKQFLFLFEYNCVLSKYHSTEQESAHRNFFWELV